MRSHRTEPLGGPVAPQGGAPGRAETAPGRRARKPSGALAVGLPVLDLVGRMVALWLLYTGLLAFSRWVGHQVLAPGAWLALDDAVFRALNSIEMPVLTSVLFTLLNDPGPDYFVLIVALLGYCGWRRRAALPAAALATGVALALGQVATHEAHHAGTRERPFTRIEQARTPIMSCSGPAVVAIRDATGPSASCDAPAPVRGLDWRDIWTQFPGFPSGHMRETGALSVLLVTFWRASWPYALLYLTTIGFSRIHLGAHYPTDVLGGTVMGLWAGAITLLGLDAVRRFLLYLYRVPPVRVAWDWVWATRIVARPDLDPLPARLLRIMMFVLVAHVALYGLGFASTSADVGLLYSVLQNVDYFAYSQVTARFDPALAPVLHWALGPGGPLYVALGALTLVAAWIRVASAGREARWRSLLAAALMLLLAAGLAVEQNWAGRQWFQREPPIAALPEVPVPLEWRAAWAATSSYPSQHALLATALAGVLASLAARLAVLAQLIGLAAAIVAMYFGAAWLADALSGFLLGNIVAATARYATQQFIAEAPSPESEPSGTPGPVRDWPSPARSRPAEPVP